MAEKEEEEGEGSGVERSSGGGGGDGDGGGSRDSPAAAAGSISLSCPVGITVPWNGKEEEPECNVTCLDLSGVGWSLTWDLISFLPDEMERTIEVT